jgi:hypothetical protein
MKANQGMRRSVESLSEALVLASGAVATAVGAAMALHLAYGVVRLAVSFIGA